MQPPTRRKPLLKLSICLSTLLQELVDYDAVARFPGVPYRVRQASSYDRRSVAKDQPGWFSNHDYNEYVRDEQVDGHTEHVMLDADGPGAIVRFWLTTDQKSGIIRFYFDGATQASLTTPTYDLLAIPLKLTPPLLAPHANYNPKGEGGSTLYLPLAYGKHCKVTLEDVGVNGGKALHFYQIDHRTYVYGTKVQTLTQAELAADSSQVDRVQEMLLHPQRSAPVITKANKLVAPGDQLKLALSKGENAVRWLEMHLSSDGSSGELRPNVRIRMEFDGVTTVVRPSSISSEAVLEEKRFRVGTDHSTPMMFSKRDGRCLIGLLAPFFFVTCLTTPCGFQSLVEQRHRNGAQIRCTFTSPTRLS